MKGESSATPSHAPYMFCGDGCKTVTVGAKHISLFGHSMKFFCLFFFTDFFVSGPICLWALDQHLMGEPLIIIIICLA